MLLNLIIQSAALGWATFSYSLTSWTLVCDLGVGVSCLQHSTLHAVRFPNGVSLWVTGLHWGPIVNL